MKLKLLLAGLIILITTLYSCEDKTVVESKEDELTSSLTYNANPYNNFGVWHNNALEFTLNNYQPTNTTTEQELIDSVSKYVKISLNSETGFPIITTIPDPGGLLYLADDPFVALDSLSLVYITNMYANNKISALDYYYSMQIYNLMHLPIVSNNYNVDSLYLQVVNLETVMLADTNWATNDKLAFFTISILKHSLLFQVTHPDLIRSSKNDSFVSNNKHENKLLKMSAKERFGCSMVDYGTAVCAVGVATAGTGGVALGAGVLIAVSTATAGSSAASYWGHFFNLW